MSELRDELAQLITLHGRVQGVGMRPYLYRLAKQHQLNGWVENGMGQVLLHIEGKATAVEAFCEQLNPPLPARIDQRQQQTVACQGLAGFTIRPSHSSVSDVHLLPDLPPCEVCLSELFDSNNRRHRYPFINCSHCGPRYSLIDRLPYDRANTSMADFPMCKACDAEYGNVEERRFHAEPLACAECGPALSYHVDDEQVVGNEPALAAAITAIKQGHIIAVKGVGGYHLVCDASNPQAIQRLRLRKQRPHKPLAIMGSERYLSELVELDDSHWSLLRSPARPIVLAPAKIDTNDIAPNLNEIGVMLPYSPLHVLLLNDFGGPLVFTSANLSGEPVLIDNDQIEQRLSHVVEGFLHHNRTILHPADDPIFRMIANQPRPLRLGRGNAPLEMSLPFDLDQPLLALGGHMKNSIALAWQNRLVISPYIGELDTPRAQKLLVDTVAQLTDRYQVKPEALLLDTHPAYGYRRWAELSGLPIYELFHHHAHAAQLVGEYPDESNWLVFTWDGTGLGEDQTLWGGEALLGSAGNWRRVASIEPFSLVGGDKVSRQPWRSAAALCWQAGIDYQPPMKGASLLRQAWKKGINCHQSSSMGRLFDGAAALLGLCDHASFEGQGAMWLEALAADISAEAIALPLSQDQQGICRADWGPLLVMLRDKSLTCEQRAAIFHESLAQALLQQTLHMREQYGEFAVGLSGGVFQNRRLSERVLTLLQGEGFQTHLPQSISVSDAGLAYGQVIQYYYAKHSNVGIR